jgi:hypothetical protein
VIANKFALIFVNFLRQDFPDFWQDAFTHLFGLLNDSNANDEYKLKVVRFIIKVLYTFNTELVERGESKVSFDVMLAQKVKDGVRIHAISSILEML